MNDNSKLAVAALQNGTVIDHIPECVLDFRISDKMSEEIRDVFR